MFKIDTIELGRAFCLDNDDWKPWKLPDGTDCFIPHFVEMEREGRDWYLLVQGKRAAVMRDGCMFFEQTCYPLAERDFVNDPIDDLPEMLPKTSWTGVPVPGWEFPLDETGSKKIAEGAERLRRSTDRAIIGLFGGNMFEIPCYLFGMERYMSYMGLYPEQCIRFSEKLCEIHLANLEKWLPRVGPYIDVVLFGDDLGSYQGPLISPGMYRKYFLPYHSRLWNRAKQIAPHIKTQLHCCGGIVPLLKDMIEGGLDSINPVQVGCAAMEPKLLKQQYGDRITFWGGGCDTRSILPGGTPDEVRRCVRERIELFSPGNGFVFQQIHNIMSEVPPENIVAMFDEVNKIRFGKSSE
ncbi:hypothetical protein FACS1894189_4320 [Planctomycetales bacterium]|nr:hypothetical protein FACS1894189_4320 [Planctomycetales bacterium]